VEQNDHVFSVRVPESFHLQLRELAEVEHRSVANLVRVATMEYVAKRRDAAQPASSAGTEAR
jgi:predicted transcriptional regulator